MVAVPVAPKVTTLVPAFMLEPEATVNDFEAPRVTALSAVLKRLPEFTLPTEILPVTFAAVIAPPRDAPLAFVLLMFRFAYVMALVPILTVWAPVPL
jgi:hypothetical protein